MKTLLIILLYCLTLNATNWYVDRDATGATDGRSWATAWRTLDSIWVSNIGVNWHIIGNGDTIYVSGGSDSTAYIGGNVANAYVNSSPPYTGTNAGRTWSTQVVVCPSWEANHNGDVYFLNNDSTDGYQTALSIAGLSNIKFTGFNIFSMVGDWCAGGSPETPSGVGEGALYNQLDSLVVIENCHIVNSGTGAVLYVGHTNFTTINNCTLEVLYNQSPISNDPVGISDAGGTTFTNNTLITRSSLVNTTAHRDILQMGGSQEDQSGGGRLLTSTIANNFIWVLTPTARAWNAGIYISAAGDDSQYQIWNIYNNLIVMDVAGLTIGGIYEAVSPLVIINEDTPGNSMNSVKLMNNTIIGVSEPLYLRYVDSLFSRNNILICTVDSMPNTQMFIIGENDADFDVTYINSDYNHWWKPSWNMGGLTQGFTNGNYTSGHHYTWTEWIALDNSPTSWIIATDSNSDTGYVSIADVRDSVISAYATPVGLIGTDLSEYFTTDINGDTRTIWYMGAVNPAEVIPPTNVRIRVIIIQ